MGEGNGLKPALAPAAGLAAVIAQEGWNQAGSAASPWQGCSRRNTHLGMDGEGAPVRNAMVKHVGSWERNIPAARTLRSDLCSGGNRGKQGCSSAGSDYRRRTRLQVLKWHH